VAPLPPDDAPPDDLVDIGPMLPVHAANAAPAKHARDTQGGAALPIQIPLSMYWLGAAILLKKVTYSPVPVGPRNHSVSRQERALIIC
jgi:hypothetical protein